uniref:Uncharacterized protein n=1 Tax=Anopheles epiroticus TaxID=199890 RepID=A0A182P9A0_9DIPT
MKPIVVYVLAGLLLVVSPALARPNLVEPIYLRRRSNPLEIVEESVEAGSAQAQDLSGQSSTEQHSSSTGTTTEVTTTESGSSSTSSSSSTSTHQPRYQPTTNDGLSSDSLIKEFLLKNLANLQGQSPPPVAAPAPADAATSEAEQNTLRSVSLGVSGLGYPPLPNWDPPEKSYIYPIKVSQYPTVSAAPLEVEIGQKRKPVIHKIMTKWSDKTSDVFNVDYGTPGDGGSLLRPSNQIYSTGFGVTKPADPPVEQHFYSTFGSPEVLSTNFHTPSEEVYQQGPGPIVSDQLLPFGTSDTKNKNKKQKKKNKIKITIKPTATPVKVVTALQPQSDPDRPDAVYSGEQLAGVGTGWNPYEDPYDAVDDANPYDEAGDLKGEAVPECNEITISLNGKQGCNDIQIAINENNPSPTKQGELTKLGPGAAGVVPGAAVVAAAAATAGTAGALSAAPQAAAAVPAAAVASDVALAAPLSAAAVAPAAVPVVPAAIPAPVTSFLNTPISSLVSNIIRPPVRLGAAGQPAATIGNGIGANQNKLKPTKHGKPASHDHGSSSLLPDVSHALLGMMAAVSAMTPMNMFVLGMTSLPVLAMIIGTVAAGMYMYKFYYPTPVRHYTTTVLVQKRPPVSYHWTRKPGRPGRRPIHTSSWTDYDPHAWGPATSWDNDRRSMRQNSDPYRRQKPKPTTTNAVSPGSRVR